MHFTWLKEVEAKIANKIAKKKNTKKNTKKKKKKEHEEREEEESLNQALLVTTLFNLHMMAGGRSIILLCMVFPLTANTVCIQCIRYGWVSDSKNRGKQCQCMCHHFWWGEGRERGKRRDEKGSCSSDFGGEGIDAPACEAGWSCAWCTHWQATFTVFLWLSWRARRKCTEQKSRNNILPWRTVIM